MMGFNKQRVILGAGETKAFAVVTESVYSILISVSGTMNAANAFYFASGYGVSQTRNSVYKIVGGLQLGVGYGETIKGFSLTNNLSINVTLDLFFMNGSSCIVTSV